MIIFMLVLEGVWEIFGWKICDQEQVFISDFCVGGIYVVIVWFFVFVFFFDFISVRLYFVCSLQEQIVGNIEVLQDYVEWLFIRRREGLGYFVQLGEQGEVFGDQQGILQGSWRLEGVLLLSWMSRGWLCFIFRFVECLVFIISVVFRILAVFFYV